MVQRKPKKERIVNTRHYRNSGERKLICPDADFDKHRLWIRIKERLKDELPQLWADP